MEPLVELDPEDAATGLAGVAFRSEEIGARRERARRSLADSHAAADVLPLVVNEGPRAEHRVEILPVAGGAVVVQVSLEAGDQVAVRRRQGVLPDRIFLPSGQGVHPPVLHVVLLGNLEVLWLADRREVGPRAGDVPLVGVATAIDQAREHRVPVVEPVSVAAEQAVGFRVAGDGRLDQPVGKPGPAVVGLFAARLVGRIGKDVAVGLTAGLDAVDHLVEPLAKLRVLDPAERVAGAHEEPARVGTAEINVPESDLRTVVWRIFLPGADPERPEHVVDGEGIQ